MLLNFKLTKINFLIFINLIHINLFRKPEVYLIISFVCKVINTNHHLLSYNKYDDKNQIPFYKYLLLIFLNDRFDRFEHLSFNDFFYFENKLYNF